MAARIAAETAVGVLLTLVLLVGGVAIMNIVDGTSAVSAFTDEAPRSVFGTVGIAFGLWAVLVAIGNTVNRRRAAGWKLLANSVSALVLAVVNVLAWVVIAVPQGGFALLLVAIVLVVSAIFVVVAALALWLTHLVLFRQRATGTADGVESA
jgi:hypothetical protein